MAIQVQQVDATRNQSTALFALQRLCTFDNRFQEGSFRNNTGASYTFPYGSLLLRDTANPGGYIPAIAGATLANVIGVAIYEGAPLVLPDATPLPIVNVTKGGINANFLSLPAGVTLDTIVGSKSVEDILNALGLVIDRTVVENTIYDNY